MEAEEIRKRIREAEPDLPGQTLTLLITFEREGRPIHVALTDRLRRRARKEGVWNTREMAATVKNAACGFDPLRARSPGGADGIFVLDRAFRPANAMMRKLFDSYLDKPGGGAAEVAAALGVARKELIPVRLVSHPLRLLGVLRHAAGEDWLVLVDCDRT